MKKPTLKEEFSRLDSIQDQVYSQFRRNQQQLQRQYDHVRNTRQNELIRKEVIGSKTAAEQVKHPYNNHIWMHLAHFQDQPGEQELDQIKRRQQQRRMVRQKMQNEQQHVPVSEQTQIVENERHGGKKKRAHKQGSDKLEWKLARELRRQEVKENKARLDRIREAQEQRMRGFHGS